MPGNDKKRVEKELMQRRGDSSKMDAGIRKKEVTVGKDTIRSGETTARFVLCLEKPGA